MKTWLTWFPLSWACSFNLWWVSDHQKIEISELGHIIYLDQEWQESPAQSPSEHAVVWPAQDRDDCLLTLPQYATEQTTCGMLQWFASKVDSTGMLPYLSMQQSRSSCCRMIMAERGPHGDNLFNRLLYLIGLVAVVDWMLSPKRVVHPESQNITIIWMRVFADGFKVKI